MSINITNEDNMELMARYPDKYFDLAIVDPPYGINAPNMKMGENNGYKSTASKVKGRLNSGGGKLKNRILNNSNIDWDNEIPSSEYFNELFRVSKNQIIFGGNYFPLPPTRGIIFWDKLQPWENFSQFELAWTSFDKPAAKIAISTTGGANIEKKIHPTQKPVELYKWIFDKYGDPNFKYLDTHHGSGSISIAFHDMINYWKMLGKDVSQSELIGCDKNETHYQDSIERINNYCKPNLFQ
ncbi:site-specific DNA-methyltransferase [Empedobacter brevis]|uniref:site-specific DNA-methyltransferase n=1 Tax=Empedobacter brevis TaxID=247 RepID=UPI0023F46BBF|nr:site-specific DNA-methyltransferase [Empedobacter brevis]